MSDRQQKGVVGGLEHLVSMLSFQNALRFHVCGGKQTPSLTHLEEPEIQSGFITCP